MTQRSGGPIFPPGMRPVVARSTAPHATSLAEAGSPVPGTSTSSGPKPPATETLARRVGAVVNEIDFPGFVAQLVNGTFDAIVDASIRQMESYSNLVAAVAKTVDQFTEENVTPNQARDWVAQRYPGDVAVLLPSPEQPEPRLVPRTDALSPAWLTDFGLEGEELTPELLEERVVPQVRAKVGTERQQLLATMVLLGMNRVAVRDGSITAKVMFRAAAQDSAKVSYATGSDPQGVANWGERGSMTYGGASTSIRADLFGEVKLNFVSETLPLERLVDAAKIALVQRNAPAMRPAGAATPAVPATPATPGNTEGGQ